MKTSLKILVSPLDWGLGHTTRCLPLIAYLLQEGHKVTAAAEGASAAMLRANFPALDILPLEGYRIRYSRYKAAFTLKILMQVPRILAAVRKERRWLLQQQALYRFDAVISDNRYGLYCPGVPCVFMTHQLQVRTGMGRLADHILRKLHYRMLRCFESCWVVDEAGDGALAGTLAHPDVLPEKAVYTGLLSQFQLPVPQGAVNNLPLPENGKDLILVLLSGPEPMRSALERLILRQAATLKAYHFIVVAGNPGGAAPSGLPDNCSFFSHLNAGSLRPVLERARLVICRSGYSTLMDLATLGKNALLIPTPGQTEQEYLARHLALRGRFLYRQQRSLDLREAIPSAFRLPEFSARPGGGFAPVLDALLQRAGRAG